MPHARHIPRATYRLQLNRHFPFQQAAEVLDYLRDLGISDLYLSPPFKAGPQSTHGYDVCGFDQFSPGLGGADHFERLINHAHELGLSVILDMVPNHMGADLSNAWWLDVLQKGPASKYASFFDIDWHPPDPALTGKIVLPVLEDHYAAVLEAGKLKLEPESGGLAIAYYDRRFPVAEGSCNLSPAEIQQVNGKAGEPNSFDRLHALLQRQHYRLGYWRAGSEVINYRRFFDVTELVSLRMELAEVFSATHELAISLVQTGRISGLRIDHPDGLWDPKRYFERLRAATGPQCFIVAEKILTGEELLPLDWPIEGTTGYDFLNRLNGLFVQSQHRAEFDRLYQEFTGCAEAFGALRSRSKRQLLGKSFVGERNSLTRRLKRLADATRYGQDLTWNQLQRALGEILVAFPVYRTYINEHSQALVPQEQGYVEHACREAEQSCPDLDPRAVQFIRDLLLPRTPWDFGSEENQAARAFVMKFQQLSGPLMAKGLEDTAFYNFNRLVSLNEVGGEPDLFGCSVDEFHWYNRMKAERWPHSLLATATHDTKRGEDLRARLNVLSEIPEQWAAALRRWQQLNACHKTVLNGRPAPHANDEYLFYQMLVGAWFPEAEAPECLTTLRQRLVAYMLKAIREAKARTSWTSPDSAYEEATSGFVEKVLHDSRPNSFLKEFTPFQQKIAFFGTFNSLSQVLLKLAAPGVPDFYQGTELWDYNLVDPDNRRPVDYPHRRKLFRELTEAFRAGTQPASEKLQSLLQEPRNGKVKMYLIWRALQLRRAWPEVFEHGSYLPLIPSGPKQQHVCAFARIYQEQTIVAIAPRLVLGLTSGEQRPPSGPAVWGDTALPLVEPLRDGAYLNVLTQERLEIQNVRTGFRLAEVLANFPVALLQRV